MQHGVRGLFLEKLLRTFAENKSVFLSFCSKNKTDFRQAKIIITTMEAAGFRTYLINVYFRS
jgi:hypothetical protein